MIHTCVRIPTVNVILFCYSLKLKMLVIVNQFHINNNNKLVLCEGKFVLGKEGVHKIELRGGTTVIDTETSKIMFSPLFGDNTMHLLWEWIHNKDMHNVMMCEYTVSEAFPWITDKSHPKYLLRKLNYD